MSSIAPRIDEPSQEGFPTELYSVIYSNLQGEGEDPGGDRQITRTAEVCTRWRDDRDLQRLRNLASQHLWDIEFVREFPREMHQLFRECHLAIVDLPIVDANNLIRTKPGPHDDFVTFIDPNDMTAPIMRFMMGGITNRRPGFALLLRAIDPHTGQPIDRVLTIFKRIQHFPGIPSNIDKLWGYAWSQDQKDIEALIQQHHLQHEHRPLLGPVCSTCPFSHDSNIITGDRSTLSRLLRNQHPVCTIPGLPVFQAPRSNRFSSRTILISAVAFLALSWLMHYAFFREG